jgi:hypothetical protein
LGLLKKGLSGTYLRLGLLDQEMYGLEQVPLIPDIQAMNTFMMDRKKFSIVYQEKVK